MTLEQVRRWDERVFAFLEARDGEMGEASGLGRYYRKRIKERAGLEDYERRLLELLGGEGRIFHVGIGIGALTAGLATCGVKCIGFESNHGRYQAALSLRTNLAPAARYELRRTRFPEGLRFTDRTRAGLLLFTNIVSDWDSGQCDRLIEAMHRFDRTILDLRLFGRPRNDPGEREALADRIRAAALTVTPLALAADCYYAEIRPLDAARPGGRVAKVLDGLFSVAVGWRKS